jgi:hypothetical protein
MECSQESLEEIFRLLLLIYGDRLIQYTQLWLKSELSDAEAEQLDALYTEAETDSLLSFAITVYDRILGEQTGLIDPQAIKSYKDQQAWLREHLEQVLLEQDDFINAQEFLQEAGFYKGPLDGVWGIRSRTAVTEYRREVQQLLHQKGLYSGNIDGEMGQQSVLAVQAFQKSQNLKRDGVAREQTFYRLLCPE